MAIALSNVKAMNTRIVLRNDMLSAWEASTKQLLKGEMALARLSGDLSDKYEIRIGVGNKTWNELSGSNFMIPAENVVGLENNLTSLQVKFYEKSSYAELPKDETVTNGSIGVVLETVTVAETDPEYAKLSADGKQLSAEFRTAYWFDTSLTSDTNPNGTWRQMDGNYKAENVYFTSNLKFTEAFGKHAQNATGYTLSCKNMSLTDVLKEAFSEVKKPGIVVPTASWMLGTQDTGTKEIGAWSVGLPALTFKYTKDGTWDNYNAGKTGGNVVPLSSVTIKRIAQKAEDFNGVFNLSAVNNVISSNASTNVAVNGTVVLPAIDGSEVSVQYTAASQTIAKYEGYASYLDGTTVPLDNLKGECPEKMIPGGNLNYGGATITIPVGKYPYFMFYTMGSACPDTLNTSTATKITKDNKTVDGKKMT